MTTASREAPKADIIYQCLRTIARERTGLTASTESCEKLRNLLRPVLVDNRGEATLEEVISENLGTFDSDLQRHAVMVGLKLDLSEELLKRGLDVREQNDRNYLAPVYRLDKSTPNDDAQAHATARKALGEGLRKVGNFLAERLRSSLPQPLPIAMEVEGSSRAHSDSLQVIARDLLAENSSVGWAGIGTVMAPAKWSDLLDGRPLDYSHAEAGMIISRTVHADDRLEPLSEADFGTWLDEKVGRFAYLSGDAGDGKTSYLSNLAFHHRDTHVFVQVSDISRRTQIAMSELACSLARFTTSDSMVPVLIGIYDMPIYLDDDKLFELRDELRQYALFAGPSVMILSGRPGSIERLRRVAPASQVFLNLVDTKSWFNRIDRAYRHVNNELPAKLVASRYPNLHRFAALDTAARIEAADPATSPLIACLLRAVYGPDSRALLHEEMARLDRDDRRAYRHVCLASACKRSLPVEVLRLVAPNSDIERRGERDPWITTTDGASHMARHQVIGQVTLEEDWNTPTRPGAQVFAPYAEALKHRPAATLDLLHDYIRIGAQMESTRDASLRVSFSQNILRGLRELFLDYDIFDALIIQHCGRVPHRLQSWVAALMSLLPHPEGREFRHVRFAQAIRRIIEAALSDSGSGSELLAFRYRIVGLYLEQPGEDKFHFFAALLDELGVNWNTDWSFSDYKAVFDWTNIQIRGLPLTPVTVADDLALAKAAYLRLFRSYVMMRVRRGGSLDRQTYYQYVTSALRNVHWHLPAQDAAEALYAAFKLSLDKDAVNPEIANLYATTVLGPDFPPELRNESLEDADQALLVAIEDGPLWGDALLTFLRLRPLTERRASVVRTKLDESPPPHDGTLNAALCAHARGIVTRNGAEARANFLDAADGYAAYFNEAEGQRRVFRADRVRSLWAELVEQLAEDSSPRARTNAASFNAMMTEMPPKEAKTVSASIPPER